MTINCGKAEINEFGGLMVPFAISYIFSKRWGNILRAPGSIMSNPTLLSQP